LGMVLVEEGGLTDGYIPLDGTVKVEADISGEGCKDKGAKHPRKPEGSMHGCV
jgi:hypothetical protein